MFRFNRSYSLWFLFFLSLFTEICSGQYQPFGEIPEFIRTDSQFLDIQAGFSGASDHMNYPLIHNFWKGGLVSPGKIQKNAESLAVQNRAGVNTVLGISYVGQNRMNKARDVMRFQQINSTGMRYSPDAWLLFMKGNGPFSGLEMNVSETGAMSFGAYQLSYGKAKSKKMTRNTLFWTLMFDVSAVNRLTYGYIEDGKLYTDSFGTYLDIRSKAQWNYSKQAGISGIGAGFSGNIGMNSEFSGWIIGLENISTAYTGQRMKRVNLDTAFRFEGIQISKVRDASESNYWTGQQDSLKDAFLSDETIKKWHVLPGMIYASFWQNLGEANRLLFGFNYQYLLYQMPEVYVNHRIKLKNFYISSRLSWGGWGEILWYEQMGYRNHFMDISFLAGGMQSAWMVTLPAQITGGFRLLIFPKGR